MATPALYRHSMSSKIIEFAAAEGHDADIPSNVGVIRPSDGRPPKQPRVITNEKVVYSSAPEQDAEKGAITESLSSKLEVEDTSPLNPDIVDFDGPDDPENPLNWPFRKKWGLVVLISAITFLTPLASSMFAPGVPDIMDEFHSTNDLLAGFMVSVYVLGFSFGPLCMFYAFDMSKRTHS